MGCGGSKQQDVVATGNTVSTGKLSQESEAAASKSKASSTTTTDVSSVDDSSKSIVEKAEVAEINGGRLQGNEKATTLMVVEVTEDEQVITNETPDEYLSPRKDAEIVEAEAGGEEVDHLSLRKDHDASSVVEEDGMEKELKEIETKAQEEENKEEVGLKNDDDGDSIGKRSNDFKETLSVEEMDEGEGEVVIAEKKIVEEGELVSGSSAQ